MATGNQTITTAEKHIDEVFVDGVLQALEFNLVIAPRVDRSWKFAGHGDTYRKTRTPNIESQTKTASTALNATVYTDTEQTVTINVHQACAIKHEDIAQVLSRNDVKAEMTKNMGYSLGRAVDVNLATLPQSFSQIVGTLGVELTYDNLVRAVQYLWDTGYGNDDVVMFMSPAELAGKMKLDTFVNAQYVGEANAINAHERAMFARFMGIDILRSQLLRAPAGGQHENFLFHRSMIALIMAQEPKVTKERIALDLADVVVTDQIYGFAEIDRYSETPGNITATDEGAVLMRGV